MNTKRKYFLSHLGMILCFVFLCSLIGSTDSQGAYLRNFPVKVVQPDGEELDIFASGDEFYNWLHDKDGYTIIQDPETGYYDYAILEEGKLFSSDYTVNSVDPRDLGLSKNLAYSVQRRKNPSILFPGGSPVNANEIVPAPKTGTINNIVVFIRFSGESEFTDSISTYNNMFNSTTAAYNSMRNYYNEVSYNQLTISTTFYPAATTTVVSYQDSNSRGYYQPYNATTNPGGYTGGDSGTERTDREHTLLKNAVNTISSQVPTGLNLDGDGDGNVDNVCFIVYGGPTGWSSLLWPHMWSLYSQTAYINGKRVYTYNFQLQTSLASSGVGVLCHEMFHSLGAPDLYHYSGDGLRPVWKWDIMENNLNPPQHMGAYMKKRYGTWISSIPEITTSGTYTLNPLTSSTNNSYKIASPNSTTEYFVVEYRRKTGTFEGSLPGTGLLVYRINTSEDGNGNNNGPPDEVYIYRPGGTTSVNGTPDSANFSSGVGRTSINDSTDPSGFLADGSAGGLSISNIGSADGTISFYVSVGGTGTNYVQEVIGSNINLSFWPASWTTRIVGAPDNALVSLGSGGYINVKMSRAIINGTGNDFKVYECGSSLGGTSEAYHVYGTSNCNSPIWTYIGSGSDVTSFDLSGTGLSSVPCLRLVDAGTAGGKMAGADFDTIEGLNASSSSGMVVKIDGTTVTISLAPVPGAESYTLVYAPADKSYIGEYDMGNATSVSFDLWNGAVFNVAVEANMNDGTSISTEFESFHIP